MAKIGKPIRVDNIIQFRADDSLLAQLNAVASRFHTPVGVLCRQWVAERLSREIRLDQAAVEYWRDSRQEEIIRLLHSDMESGPVQIIHMQPLSGTIEIDPQAVRKLQSSLAPIERTDEYTGRINVHGYKTQKIFRDSKRVNAYVQVFRTGQLESVRILRELSDPKGIFGEQTDDELIRAIWSYSSALQALKVSLPIQIAITYLGLKDFTLRTRDIYGPTCEFDTADMSLPVIDVTEWPQVGCLESTAETLRPSINVFWNAAGFDKSASYTAGGKWRGPLDSFGRPNDQHS